MNVQTNGIQLRIGDMLFAIQKRWKLIMTLTFVGMVMGLLLSAVSYVQSSMQNHEITGSFAIITKPEAGTYLNGAASPGQLDFTLGEDMVDAVTYLMKSDRVLDQVINEQKLLGVGIKDLRENLSIRQFNATQILEMTLAWSDDTEGLGIWNAVVAATNKLLPEILQLGRLVMINTATSEVVGASTMGKMVWIVLAMLGFCTGVGFAVMEVLMHPTLTNAKDVESVLGLETMGLIPKDDAHFNRESSLLVEDDNSPEIIQGFSAAAYILRNRLGMKEQHHCFYVTSTTNREGRSAVAANLAIQLSDMEHRTLLIDFDTRNPSLGSLFLDHVDYSNSLNALYRGDANEVEAITTLTGYLDILPTVLEHNAISMDSTVISLINKLSEKYEYIILDAPPVGKESDTLSLNQVANTVLYVVGYDMATIPDIQASLEKLDKSGIRVLGCIVNGVQNNRGRKDETRKRIARSKKKNSADEDMMEEAPRSAFIAKETSASDDLPITPGKTTRKKGKRKSGKKEAPAAEVATAPAAEASSPAPTGGNRNLMEDLINDNPTTPSNMP